ncbi:pseudouridine synthase [Thermomonas aquatica]|uniref:Pseudouridine synthase n=1 Tax=Thermomonas aquatica TaxID=2202149 RepID=A0A5B7ZN59_9GAMM|nr:pseudouridine synthase [Thermomonas aquatica]QDA56105.1 rRNA pseudouridine synthase [Thermomonas aquatica]
MSKKQEESTRRPLSLRAKAATAETAEAPRIEERLHKVLAQAGLGSRRALEQRIADGLVKVNGETARTGMSVTGGDKIEIDGKTFVASALTDPSRVLMYNKPEGEVTSREDTEGRPTIFDALPSLKGARWIAIGRLDINTTGLLLLTTDGELANAMMHPSFEVAREYVCRVRAPEGEDVVSDKIVDRLARGVALDDGPAKFDEIERIGGTDSHDWFRVLLKEGRNREVRRLWESQGCQVSRLKRVRYGDVRLPQPLLRGQSQELPQAEVEALRKAVGLEDGAPAALTLMPVLGQRKASKTVVSGNARGHGYVGGHSTADEGRELRRFDHVREDRNRRGGPRKPHGGLTVSGEAAAKQAHKTFKPKGGPRPQGQRMKPGEQRGENPTEMRTWYVPDGVDTGPSGHRNPDGARGPRKPYGNKPAGGRGPGGPRQGNPYGGDNRGPRREGGSGAGERGPRREGGFGGGEGRPQRAAKPYGHPGNAPSFPSDHANPGGFNPYGGHGDQRGPRGPRPAGGKPGGGRPFNANGPRGPRPGGNRGPRGGGGHHGGNR